MSKAFVKEDANLEFDGAADDGDDDAPSAAFRVLLTPDGHTRLKDELKTLRHVERPKIVDIVSWAASNGDRSENGDYIYGKKRLREIDRRMRFLMKRLDVAEVVDPARQTNRDKIFFGAWVTFENSRGEEKTVRIVGVEEARLEEGEISWVSPMARALMGKEEGDIAQVQTPQGGDEVEIIAISYEGQPG